MLLLNCLQPKFNALLNPLNGASLKLWIFLYKNDDEASLKLWICTYSEDDEDDFAMERDPLNWYHIKVDIKHTREMKDMKEHDFHACDFRFSFIN